MGGGGEGGRAGGRLVCTYLSLSCMTEKTTYNIESTYIILE